MGFTLQLNPILIFFSFRPTLIKDHKEMGFTLQLNPILISSQQSMISNTSYHQNQKPKQFIKQLAHHYRGLSSISDYMTMNHLKYFCIQKIFILCQMISIRTRWEHVFTLNTEFSESMQ